MAKNYYHRSFIILKPKESGYSIISGREPAGYCKLEIRRGRGRVQVYVQDLKPAEQEGGIYELYLVSEQDKIEPIRLTSIQVNNRGRGEKAVEFDATNVNGTGYPLEMFHALAIVFKSESQEKGMRIGYPLVGYSSKNVQIDWAGRVTSYFVGSYENLEVCENEEDEALAEKEIIVSVKDEEQGAGVQEKINVQEKGEEAAEAEAVGELADQTDEWDVAVAAEEDGAEDDIPAEPAVEAADKIEDVADGAVEEVEAQVKAEAEEEEEQSIPDLVETKAEDSFEDKVEYKAEAKFEDLVEDEAEAAAENKAKDESYGRTLESEVKRSYWDNVKDYFMGLFKTHSSIRPFAEDMGDAEWIMVQQPGIYLGYYAGPYYSQTYSPYNQIYNGATYFDHYIVGLIRQQGEVKYVVYGVPSMYSMMPPTNMMGFSRWVPVRNGYGMGYWLAYIDAATGCIVYPYGKE